jgi:hypothetical protein
MRNPHVRFGEDAIKSSSSALLFPHPDGTMMAEGVQLEVVLRRALRRAGIVTGYQHVCRRKGRGHRGHREAASDGDPRRCPADNR